MVFANIPITAVPHAVCTGRFFSTAINSQSITIYREKIGNGSLKNPEEAPKRRIKTPSCKIFALFILYVY